MTRAPSAIVRLARGVAVAVTVGVMLHAIPLAADAHRATAGQVHRHKPSSNNHRSQTGAPHRDDGQWEASARAVMSPASASPTRAPAIVRLGDRVASLPARPNLQSAAHAFAAARPHDPPHLHAFALLI